MWVPTRVRHGRVPLFLDCAPGDKWRPCSEDREVAWATEATCHLPHEGAARERLLQPRSSFQMRQEACLQPDWRPRAGAPWVWTHRRRDRRLRTRARQLGHPWLRTHRRCNLRPHTRALQHQTHRRHDGRPHTGALQLSHPQLRTHRHCEILNVSKATAFWGSLFQSNYYLIHLGFPHGP